MFSSPFILFENNISPNTMVISTAEVAASSVSSSPNSSSIPPSSKSSSSNLEYKKKKSSLSSIDKTFDSNFISAAAALKEWAIVCKAIEDGKQVLLFRKGGIMEYRNGFELKHKVFFLFPTFEHQSIDSIQNEYREELEVLKQQQQQKDNTQSLNQKENNTSNEKNSKVTQDNINISTFVEMTHFIEINDISKLEKLKKYHIWNLDYVKMRLIIILKNPYIY